MNKNTVRALLCALLIVLGLGAVPACSTPDSGDMSELEDTIDAIDEVQRVSLNRLVIREKTRKWLEGKFRGERIGYLRCGTGADIKKIEYLVQDLLDFLETNTSGHDGWKDFMRRFWAIKMLEQGQMPVGGNCVPVYDFQYDPNGGHVPDEVLNPDTSARGIIEWLIASPAPPPGLVWTGGLARLLPFLCTLGAGWGCPSNPGYPGPTSPGNVPSPDGDAP